MEQDNITTATDASASIDKSNTDTNIECLDGDAGLDVVADIQTDNISISTTDTDTVLVTDPDALDKLTHVLEETSEEIGDCEWLDDIPPPPLPTDREIIRDMFKDRNAIFYKIVRMFKFIQKEVSKETWEKTEKEVLEDISNSTFLLEEAMQKKPDFINFLNSMNRESVIKEKYRMIEHFLDICYVYFATAFDEKFPSLRLPNNLMKFYLINEALLGMSQDYYKDIIHAFGHVIDDKLMQDIRTYPPYLMRTEKTIEELNDDFTQHIKPLLREVFKQCCLLNNRIKGYDQEAHLDEMIRSMEREQQEEQEHMVLEQNQQEHQPTRPDNLMDEEHMVLPQNQQDEKQEKQEEQEHMVLEQNQQEQNQQE